MPFYLWSGTAGANGSIDPTINFQEGQSPSSVNDSARAMMAALALWRVDISGSIGTGGTSSAFTLVSNQGFDTLAHMNNAMIAFVPHATNAQGATLNVDGLGAKTIAQDINTGVGAGVLVQGTPYVVTYNNSTGLFMLQGFFGNPFNLPIGGLMPYVGSTPPNSNFVFPSGQAISRTTYATLFSLTSTTFGPGDGSTTFNVLDLRGRSVFGLDNMNGTPANRITVAGGNFDGTSLGSVGGSQNHTLSLAEAPAGQITLNFSDPGHTHPQDARTYLNQAGASAPIAGGTLLQQGGTTGSSTTGITASLSDHAGGGAHTILNPCMVLPFILRVI